VRRWILVLLLAVLPLQFAQAAAAAYCAHEETVTSQHVGHHEHEHHETAADTAGSNSADTDSVPAGAADPDCTYCHLSCAQPLGSVAPALSDTLIHSAVQGPTLAFGSHEADDVERPKWSLAPRSARDRMPLVP
jgi:hypothetical protein